MEATRPAAHSEVTDALVTAEGPVDPGALVPVDPAAEDSKFAFLAARNIQTYESMIKTCEELGDPLAQSYMEIRRNESRKRLRRANPAVRKESTALTDMVVCEIDTRENGKMQLEPNLLRTTHALMWL